MATNGYVRGTYVRIDMGREKRYVPILQNNKGAHIRYSQNNQKTATLAEAWALAWAKRVNKRAEGKVPLSSKTEDRGGRYNITFMDMG